MAVDVELAARFRPRYDRSHGLSFVALLEARFTTPGRYLMDQPESALSFQGQLILMRTTGATIYEPDDVVETVAEEEVPASGCGDVS
jgi:predicted ATPase